MLMRSFLKYYFMNKLLLLCVLFFSMSCSRQLPQKAFKLSATLNEVSGLYLETPNHFWWLNDGGNKAALYQTDGAGNITKTIALPRFQNRDWEDLSKDDKGNIYIGDFGNNTNQRKKRVEFCTGPTQYAERMVRLFGMKSVKALSLFNQVVGIKLLGDLDEFIRFNMLEKRQVNEEYKQLKTSFITLMSAKNDIDKTKEQIKQLTPIVEIAKNLKTSRENLEKLENEEISSTEINIDMSELIDYDSRKKQIYINYLAYSK